MVYDTSGVYTDPNVQIDLNKGLPSVRQNGLKSVTILTFFLVTSKFGQERLKDIRTADIRFAHIQNPRRAKAGKMSLKCTMPSKVLSRLKWNILQFVKISVNVKL